MDIRMEHLSFRRSVEFTVSASWMSSACLGSPFVVVELGCTYSHDDTSHTLGSGFSHLLNCGAAPSGGIILLERQNIEFYYNMLYSIKQLEIMQMFLNKVFIK